MNYSYQFNPNYQSSNCACQEEISLLQEKLREIHTKLLRQIDICKDQERTIINLKETIQKLNSIRQRDVYESFGHHVSKNKENYYQNSKYDEQSRQGYQIKNQLLQSDLDVMRHRVLTEITEKNKILQEMGDMKKRHRRQMALQVKKFEGLDILYRKLLQDKGISAHQVPSKTRAQVQRLTKQLQEAQQKYQKERQKMRLVESQNKLLSEKLKQIEEKQAYSRLQSKISEEPQSSDQLRQIESLKQQISRMNKSIGQRSVEFKQKSNERKRARQKSRQELSTQNKLIEARWGRRQYP